MSPTQGDKTGLLNRRRRLLSVGKITYVRPIHCRNSTRMYDRGNANFMDQLSWKKFYATELNLAVATRYFIAIVNYESGGKEVWISFPSSFLNLPLNYHNRPLTSRFLNMFYIQHLPK